MAVEGKKSSFGLRFRKEEPLNTRRFSLSYTLFLGMLFVMNPLSSRLEAQEGKRLVIHPKEISVKSGNEVRFTAVLNSTEQKSFTPRSIRWLAEGGRIDEHGRFLAGQEQGTFPVLAVMDSFSAEAQVTVIPSKPSSGLRRLPGSIFINAWRLRPLQGSRLHLHIRALINGQTVEKAKLFLINANRNERLLHSTEVHHTERIKLNVEFAHEGWRWIELRSYDHLGRVIARLRRPL